MMAEKCHGCNTMTGFICIAQYLNGDNHGALICADCYQEKGYRCWVMKDGSLTVKIEQPEHSRPATLYWDEAGRVTGGQLEFTYPEIFQPDP